MMQKRFSKAHTVQPSITRKHFIATTLAGLGSTYLSLSPLTFLQNGSEKIKAIAFDAFVIFNPQPVFNLVTQIYPDKGAELIKLWRTKQFEYSWLRTAAGKYKNFWEVTADALVFSANALGVSLSTDHKKQLIGQYLSLDLWPDVLPALQQLKQKGLRLSFLSNMTTDMLTSCMTHTKIETYFEKVISTDLAETYKPDPKAYRLGMDAIKLAKEEILFVAFAGWDASGSKWFGYPTFWMNRLQSPAEELNVIPDAEGKTLSDVVSFLNQ